MNATLFPEFVEKWFKPIVGKVTEKINGQKAEKPLLYKTMLVDEYSADLTWDSATISNSIVAADVVAMDSSLPLKRRPVFGVASGKVPKLGLKFRKGEKEISDIQVMEARGAKEEEIVAKLFNDVPRVIKGMEYRKEIMFQQALSTGEILVADDTDENVGTGIRVKFGYKDENGFKAAVAWSTVASATPITDLQQLFDKADEDGNTITGLLMSKAYFNYMRQTVEAKELVANNQGIIYTSTNNLRVPNREGMVSALESEFGVTVTIVDSTFRVENPDGSFTTVRPWDSGAVVAIPSEKVGRLFWSTLVEENRPVEGVAYEKSGHVLVAKFSKTDPFEEFTTGQSLEIPVIDEAPNCYILHADRTAEVSVDPSTLSFLAAGSTKSAAFKADGDVTAASDETWCTVAVNNKTRKVAVTAAANSGAARTATVTITDASGDTATISVSQGA